MDTGFQGQGGTGACFGLGGASHNTIIFSLFLCRLRAHEHFGWFPPTYASIPPWSHGVGRSDLVLEAVALLGQLVGMMSEDDERGDLTSNIICKVQGYAKKATCDRCVHYPRHTGTVS